MTIQNEVSKAVYIADGNTATFEIPFYFFDNEIAVYGNNEITALEQGKDYTVTNYENSVGGEVVFTTAPQSGSRITILRDVALTQLITFIEGEDFPAQDYENSLDKMIMALQEIKETTKRMLVMSPGATISQEEFYKMIETVNQNLEFLTNIPRMLDEIQSLYESFFDNVSNTVQAGDKQPISSEGVWNYINENGAKKYSNISIATSSIQEDETYENYPYCAEISISEAKSTHIPFVIFDMEAAESGNYAPLAEAKEGKVCIYLKDKPVTETLTIPALVLQ